MMDLNEAAREVTALSLTEIQRSGVILRQELAGDLPPVLGDRIQLQQVILNLLRNGADAMSTINDRPRELLVKTGRDDGNQVRLSVKDLGVGLTPQAADKIFQAFDTTKADGMGIGLSISRSIIEAHQVAFGRVRTMGPALRFPLSSLVRLKVWLMPRLVSIAHPPFIRSAGYFEGSIRTSAIPKYNGRRLAMLHGRVMGAPKGSSGDTGPLLSVVVDDDESMRESVPDLIQEFGYAVELFVGGGVLHPALLMRQAV